MASDPFESPMSPATSVLILAMVHDRRKRGHPLERAASDLPAPPEPEGAGRCVFPEAYIRFATISIHLASLPSGPGPYISFLKVLSSIQVMTCFIGVFLPVMGSQTSPF